MYKEAITTKENEKLHCVIVLMCVFVLHVIHKFIKIFCLADDKLKFI